MRIALDDALLPACHQDGYEGFRNVYMRMAWDIPSPTITAGCTTPAKGRFGHPDRRRTTISVREAATIQTFPQDFQFETDKIDTVCQMIGNAVPPLFAERLAKQVRSAVLRHRAETRNG
jgi:DNA (cytosine-5)-methyltransferase 1